MDRESLAVALIVEQRDWSYLPQVVVTCAYCGLPAGGKFPPADRPHEWLLKRSSGVDHDIIFTPINTVLLHKECHAKYGQTEEMITRCYRFKKKLGKEEEIHQWLNKLKAEGHLHHVPTYIGDAPDNGS